MHRRFGSCCDTQLLLCLSWGTRHAKIPEVHLEEEEKEVMLR